MDGVHFPPEDLPKYRLPIKGCKNPICWCDIVGIYSDAYSKARAAQRALEQQSRELKRLASRKFGEGRSGEKSEAIPLYRESRQKYLEAWTRERMSLAQEAVSLYRESIQIDKSVAEKYSVELDWSHLDYVLDRLTLVLARNGRPDEALAEIAAYRATGRESAQSSDTWNAILKREARIKKRLAREKPDTGAGTELR